MKMPVRYVVEMFIDRVAASKNYMKEKLHSGHRFLTDESGMGTVELILIIVVLIGLVIIFKKQLTSLVNTIFETITSKSNDVLG